MIKLRCVLMRGGTSKAVFFHDNELPLDPKLRDKVVLDVFGSPDIREIDGLGGADGSSSKLAIVSRYNGPEADVEYNFGQVMFDEPLVSYGLNCGNISAAVGPFAVDEGLVDVADGDDVLRADASNVAVALPADADAGDVELVARRGPPRAAQDVPGDDREGRRGPGPGHEVTPADLASRTHRLTSRSGALG